MVYYLVKSVVEWLPVSPTFFKSQLLKKVLDVFCILFHNFPHFQNLAQIPTYQILWLPEWLNPSGLCLETLIWIQVL